MVCAFLFKGRSHKNKKSLPETGMFKAFLPGVREPKMTVSPELLGSATSWEEVCGLCPPIRVEVFRGRMTSIPSVVQKASANIEYRHLICPEWVLRRLSTQQQQQKSTQKKQNTPKKYYTKLPLSNPFPLLLSPPTLFLNAAFVSGVGGIFFLCAHSLFSRTQNTSIFFYQKSPKNTFIAPPLLL